MNKKQIGYHAAANDGEGCIDINKDKRYNSYILCVYVSNTNLYFLNYLKEISNIGSIYSGGKSKEHHKIKWRWCLRKNEIKEYLEIISNELIIKRKQAKLMLEFLPLINNAYRKITEDNFVLRDIIWEEIKILNKKGVSN